MQSEHLAQHATDPVSADGVSGLLAGDEAQPRGFAVAALADDDDQVGCVEPTTGLLRGEKLVAPQDASGLVEARAHGRVVTGDDAWGGRVAAEAAADYFL